jgi:hypothetical protein
MRLSQSNLIYLFLLSLLLLCGCGNAKLFKIAPRTQVEPEKLCCQTVTADVLIAAEPLIDEDKMLATFDGNMMLSGVLPVQVLIENRSSTPIDLRHAQFTIVDSRGRQHKELDSKHALDKMIKYYGINYQRQGALKATLEDLGSVSLTHQSNLGVADRNQGFLYFEFDSGQPPQGLKLLIKRIPAANTKSAIEVDLTRKP